MTNGTLPNQRIARLKGPAVFLFWLVQIFLGVPSIGLTIQLLVSGKAEGALFSISLFLAWIGATLAIGVGNLIFGGFEIRLPANTAIETANERWISRQHGRPRTRANIKDSPISVLMEDRSKY